MQLEELKQKASKAVFWNFSGTLMKQGITFIISVFLARLLSPADFGLVGMASVFIALTQSFTDFGMTSGLIQKKEPSDVQYSTVFYINIFVAIILMIIMIVFSNTIATYYKNPEVGKIARLVSCSFVLNAINGVQNARLTKILANKIKTIAIISSVIVTGLVGILLANLNFGVWSLVYGTLCGNIVNTIVIWHYSDWRPKALFDFSEVKPLLNFGSKMFVSGILDTFYSKIDVLIIGKLFSANTLGYYFRAISLNQLVTRYTSGSLQGVFFPMISQLQNDKDTQLKVITKSLHLVSFFTFLLMGFLYLTAYEVFVILFSDKWLASIEYFQIMVFYSYAYPISVILVNILSGNGKSGMFLRLEIWKKAIGLLAMGVGFMYGVNGLLWGMVISSTVAVFINMWYVEKTINWKIFAQCKIIYQYAIMSVISTFLIFLLFKFLIVKIWISIILKTIIFVLAYFTLNFFMKSSAYNTLKEMLSIYLIKNRWLNNLN